MNRIPFKAVGYLPAPEGLPRPMIYVPLFHPFGETQFGAVRVYEEDHPDRKTRYSFTPMQPQDGWRDWLAKGWEDCEVGRIELVALGPDGSTYSWKIFVAHDGDPTREFWGWRFEEGPTKIEASS
jgi:hypothetical protein|tara:strand:- start:377 stop:751 length:375 start_codon:yes stop_codon:yes gene_type:complete